MQKVPCEHFAQSYEQRYFVLYHCPFHYFCLFQSTIKTQQFHNSLPPQTLVPDHVDGHSTTQC